MTYESWLFVLMIAWMLSACFWPRGSESSPPPSPPPEPTAEECEANAAACLEYATKSWGVSVRTYYVERAQAWALLAQAKRAKDREGAG